MTPRCALVFDDGCRFCQRQVARIQRWDRADSFEYVPRSAPDLFTRFPRLAGADLNSGLRLVHPDGPVFVGADAVYEIARRLPGWRWLAWLYHIPGLHGLCRWIYGRIAANRNRLGGACSDGCSPERPG